MSNFTPCPPSPHKVTKDVVNFPSLIVVKESRSQHLPFIIINRTNPPITTKGPPDSDLARVSIQVVPITPTFCSVGS